jgi:hypothetical protein
MQTAQAELGLDDLRVAYPGERCFPLAEGIDAIGLAVLCQPVKPRRPTDHNVAGSGATALGSTRGSGVAADGEWEAEEERS